MSTQAVPHLAMNFTENHQGSNILDKMRVQRDARRFCDVVLHVEGKKYMAHRNVLAACSPYFDSMLKPSTISKEQVFLPCQNQAIFEVLLDYVYTGKVVVDQENVFELVQLANHLLIGRLKDHCSEYLERYMNITNCLQIQDVAEKCGMPALEKSATTFIKSNVNLVVLQEGVLQVPPPKLEMVLAERNFLLTEEVKLDLIMRWTEVDVPGRHKNLYGMLAWIQWDRIDVNMIFHTMENNQMLKADERCMYAFLLTLLEHSLLMPNYMEYFTQLKDQVQRAEAEANATALCSNKKDEAQDPMVSDKEETSLENAVGEKAEETSAIGDLSNTSCSTEVTGEAQNGDNVELQTRKRGRKTDRPLKVVKRAARERRAKVPNTAKTEKLGKCEQGDKCNSTVENNAKIEDENTGSEGKTVASTGEANEKEEISKDLDLMADDDLFKTGAMSSDEDEDEVDDGEYDDDDDDDDDEDYEYVDVQKTKPLRKRGRPKGKRDAKKRKQKFVQKATFSCTECAYHCSTEYRLEKHVAKAHSDDTTYTCNICNGFESKWIREYTRHMKQHFGHPPYPCDFTGCEYKADRMQLLLYHRMKHTDDRPFECPVCSFKFRSKHNLKTHLKIHSGERPWQCQTCGRCFATKNTMQQHTVIHGDLRPYLCDLCGFSTKYQSHLIAHKRIHTGDVFRCTYPTCKYFTPKKSQLKAHLRIHQASREHTCKVCGRAFVEKSHLVRHERIHLEDKPFKCVECDYASSRRDKLKEHTEKHHGIYATAKTPYKPRKGRSSKLQQELQPSQIIQYNNYTLSEVAGDGGQGYVPQADMNPSQGSTHAQVQAASHGLQFPPVSLSQEDQGVLSAGGIVQSMHVTTQLPPPPLPQQQQQQHVQQQQQQQQQHHHHQGQQQQHLQGEMGVRAPVMPSTQQHCPPSFPQECYGGLGAFIALLN